MLGICEYLRAKEGNDMIRDDLNGLVTEVCVIDSEVSIEPLDFVRNELPRDESLVCGGRKTRWHNSRMPVVSDTRTFAAMFSWTFARCSSFPLKTGVV